GEDMNTLELTGLDGANPLAFLAAVGTLRLLEPALPGGCRMRWVRKGKWLPLLELSDDITEKAVVEHLHALLHRRGDSDAEKEAKAKQKVFDTATRAVKAAEERVKKRGLRGDERLKARQEEVDPLRVEAEAAKTAWLGALARAVPAFFLSLGK